MLMWLQAALYTVLRDWRVAFLLPTLLASLGTLACVYDLGRRLWTRKVGLYAAWALLFAVHFTFQAKKAQIDPLVVFFITLANYGLLRHLLCGPAWRWWWLGWFAAGLGVITKGVGVLALFMLVPALAAVAMGWPRVRLDLRNWRFWVGPLAFLAAIALWLVPMVLAATGSGSAEYRAYMNDILFRQTAKRYAQSWDHHQPWWYFLATMPSMWIPAFLLVPWAIPAWWRRLRRRCRCSAWRWHRCCRACCGGATCNGCWAASRSCLPWRCWGSAWPCSAVSPASSASSSLSAASTPR
jgi:4-amino-4-deoxy-L-arabinose transferase-like glycosyltransferase